MLITTVFSQRGTRRFEVSVRTANSSGHVLIIRTTSSRNYRPASGASFRSGHTNAVSLSSNSHLRPQPPPLLRPRSGDLGRLDGGPGVLLGALLPAPGRPRTPTVSLSRQEGPRTGQDRRDGAEESGAKRGVRLLCAPSPPRTHPSRTVAPILVPEPSVLVRKAHCDRSFPVPS